MFLGQLIKLRKNFIEVFCGSFLDLQSALYLKSFFLSFGCNNIFSIDMQNSLLDFRLFFQLNSLVEKLESEFTFYFWV